MAEEQAQAEAGKARVKVGRIAVPKPHDVLANQLRETILRGAVAEGTALPSERELVAQSGLSRGAVRSALRTLAAQGLVQTRHGRFGGSVVTLPGRESMTTAVHRFVQGRRLPLRTLQETREALEPFLARLAAMRRTDDDLRELLGLHDTLVASVDNFRAFSHVNIQWHNAVARISGNELLSALIDAVSHGLEVATTAEEYDTADTRRQVIQIHGRINDAIVAGNGELAERCMRQHLGATHARTVGSASAEIPLSEEAPAAPPAARRRRR